MRYEYNQILYNPKGKCYVQVKSYDLLDKHYWCRLLSRKDKRFIGFGFSYFQEKDLVPATDLAKAIYD